MREIANVREWWQAGDADATAMFQRAADAALVVYVPPGTYELGGSPVMLRSGAEIRGMGMGASIITCGRHTGSNFLGVFTNSDQVNGNADIVLRDLTIWRMAKTAPWTTTGCSWTPQAPGSC